MFQFEVTIILIDKKQQRVSNIWYNVGPQWVEPDTGQGVSKFGCPAQSDVKFPPDDVYSWRVYSSGLATNQLVPTRLKELSDVKLEISNKNLKIHGRSKDNQPQNLSVCTATIHCIKKLYSWNYYICTTLNMYAYPLRISYMYI